jgi:hypothetical protein
MSEPNVPAPAEQVVQSASTTALADDVIAPTHFIPQATRDNYAQIARDQARVRGTEPKQVMQELAGQFEQLHQRQPLDGYDHLAAWAADFDPAESDSPSGLAVLQARALESARRDPYQAVIGDQALVEQGVAAQRALDEGTIGVTQAPSVGDAGLLPNPGPLPVPADVTPTGDPAVAEQQQAAAQQYEQQGPAEAQQSPTAQSSEPSSGKSSSSKGSGSS